MEQAKNAVNDFISKAGHKDTTVHESIAPAVQNETVKEHQTENRTIAKDREIHQDHHHTTVQPIKDREVLPETHHHNLVGTEHRHHDHRDHDQTKHHLATEAAKFKDTSTRVSAQSATSNAMPEVAGEHVHHHVHETVQPVIHKETIEPHVVHTTVPVHETIHNKAQHHTTSALPAVNMADFKNSGGSLTGRAERTDHFTGEPHTIDKIGHGHSHPTVGSGQHSGAVGHDANTSSRTTGATGTAGVAGTTGTAGTAGNTGTTGTTRTGGTAGTTGTTGTTGTGHHHDQAQEKPKASLLDKLDPRKDADGDGKKGFFS